MHTLLTVTRDKVNLFWIILSNFTQIILMNSRLFRSRVNIIGNFWLNTPYTNFTCIVHGQGKNEVILWNKLIWIQIHKYFDPIVALVPWEMRENSFVILFSPWLSFHFWIHRLCWAQLASPPWGIHKLQEQYSIWACMLRLESSTKCLGLELISAPRI